MSSPSSSTAGASKMTSGTIRRLDDTSNSEPTLLTLPLSDFPPRIGTGNDACNDPISGPNTGTNNDASINGDEELTSDDLLLIRLPPPGESGGNGLTMNDLVEGQTVYVLGDTSEQDVGIVGEGVDDILDEDEGHDPNDPVAVRLIVEGDGGASANDSSSSKKRGKTMELMRVETSNTYIVVPPMKIKANAEYGDGDMGNGSSSKRQKIDQDNSNKNDNGNVSKKAMVTMPARSIGLVPGENSPACFFLDPVLLTPGHFASKLRGALGRFVYDPLDPPNLSLCEGNEGSNGSSEEDKIPKFGYTIPELAHICRTSESEMEHAVWNRVFGAEDALLIPYVAASPSEYRYGMLSEQGRQTVLMSIVSSFLESDLKFSWKFPTSSDSSSKSNNGKESGMELSPLMEEIRTHWHQLEDGGSHSSTKPKLQNPYLKNSQMFQNQTENSEDATQDPSQSQFTPTQLDKFGSTNSQSGKAQLADQVIWHCLRPVIHRSDDGCDEIPSKVELVPDEVAKLAAHHVFLRGTPRSLSNASIHSGSSVWWEEEEFMEELSMRMPSITSADGVRYEPNVDLLQGIAISETDSKGKRKWQYFPEVGLPSVPSQRIKSMLAMKDVWTLEEAVPYLQRFVFVKETSALQSKVAETMAKYTKVVSAKEKGTHGESLNVTKYVAMPK